MMVPSSASSLSIGTASSRARTAKVGEGDQPLIAFEIRRHRSDVVDLHYLFGRCKLGHGRFWGECGMAPAEPRRVQAVHCRPRRMRDTSPSSQAKHTELALAEPRRIRQHGLEHWLELARRARDDLSTSEVAVCCSSASLSSRVRAWTSSNSRTFSIAITAWSAKVVTSSICFSRERPHLGTRQYDHPDRRAFAQQWHSQHGAEPADHRALAPSQGRNPYRPKHRDLNDVRSQHRSPKDRRLVGWIGCSRMNSSNSRE